MLHCSVGALARRNGDRERKVESGVYVGQLYSDVDTGVYSKRNYGDVVGVEELSLGFDEPFD